MVTDRILREEGTRVAMEMRTLSVSGFDTWMISKRNRTWTADGRTGAAWVRGNVSERIRWDEKRLGGERTIKKPTENLLRLSG